MKKRIDEPSHVGKRICEPFNVRRLICEPFNVGRPIYEQPHVEVIEVEIEQGFATSNSAGDSPWEDYM